MLFHGPTKDGPPAAACADYRRKLPWASVTELRRRQEQDAEELDRTREDWAGAAEVAIYRCEVDRHGAIPLLEGRLLDRLDVAHAGVVDEDVQSPEHLDGSGAGRLPA